MAVSLAVLLAGCGGTTKTTSGSGRGTRAAGGTSTSTITPSGAPFTVAYPSNFQTTGISQDLIPNTLAIAGLDSDDFLSVTQDDPSVDIADLNNASVPFTQTQETHGTLPTTVINLDNTDKATGAPIHERGYYFTDRSGQTWALFCDWTPQKTSEFQAVCVNAINSVRI